MALMHLEQAIVVEGRDDVNAVGNACDTLIIATHGFGISAETWQEIDKAHREKGIIVLTDPDHAGEEIRRRINAKYPDAINAYIGRSDAESGGDIGVENASPDVIKEALTKALELSDRILRRSARSSDFNPCFASDKSDIGPSHRFPSKSGIGQDQDDGNCHSDQSEESSDKNYASISDLTAMGLAGCEGASESRAAVCKVLGIGYGNASAMKNKLRGFGIDIDELREAVEKIQ